MAWQKQDYKVYTDIPWFLRFQFPQFLESHEECKGRGEKCCGDYCCNSEYFDALISEIVCDSNDDGCLVIISKNTV